MKKIISRAFSFVFVGVLLCYGFSAQAITVVSNQDRLVSVSVETLDDGDTIVTELYESAMQPRAGKTGYKTSTYYSADGTAIWDVTVTGVFTYDYGVSSSATSASATVRLLHQRASYVSKDSYFSGNKATATGTVKYNASVFTMSVSISCDKYGNLY